MQGAYACNILPRPTYDDPNWWEWFTNSRARIDWVKAFTTYFIDKENESVIWQGFPFPFSLSSLYAIEYVSITLANMQVIDLCYLLLIYNMFSL